MSDQTDPFCLQRFVDAQSDHAIHRAAVRELRAGRKESHWMWFVFPQVAGLGDSPNAQRYAVSGLAEARAYLDHPVLSARLQECLHALLECGTSDPVAVLGDVDARKLQSSMTLFAAAAPDEPLLAQVLDRFFAGERDEATTRRLR